MPSAIHPERSHLKRRRHMARSATLVACWCSLAVRTFTGSFGRGFRRMVGPRKRRTPNGVVTNREMIPIAESDEEQTQRRRKHTIFRSCFDSCPVLRSCQLLTSDLTKEWPQGADGRDAAGRLWFKAHEGFFIPGPFSVSSGIVGCRLYRVLPGPRVFPRPECVGDVRRNYLSRRGAEALRREAPVLVFSASERLCASKLLPSYSRLARNGMPTTCHL